jgi:hypothetical protein
MQIFKQQYHPETVRFLAGVLTTPNKNGSHPLEAASE